MPKIIPELREKILSCARTRIIADESHDFSTRQLASDCGVAVGTIFNYFSSKEEILACIMLEDWTVCLKEMTAEAERAESTRQGLCRMEEKLRAFSEPFLAVWRGYGSRAPVPRYHALLIRQISEPLAVLLRKTQRTCGETELKVLAEMLLACSQREAGLIHQLIPVMEKLLD